MSFKFSVFSLCLFAFAAVRGQELTRMDIAFSIDGMVLPNGLAGGLNAPQPSSVDLNNDGTGDLYVFDRMGSVHLTFLHDGTPGSGQFSYAPAFESNFPEVKNWVLLRDYNGDGIQDLFGYSDTGVSGIMVFRGYYDAENRIAFERVHFGQPLDLLYFPLSNGIRVPIYVSNIDYPAIDDLDCDGDLDILTFNSGGGYVEFYLNRSVELGYGRDSLIFKLEENCWGGIYESGISVAIDLAAAPGECAQNFTGTGEDEVSFRHTGSTLLTFDADNDGDRELLLGDISFTNISFLRNGGDCEEAWLNEQDNFFPGYDFSIDLPIFPAAFYLDLNNDGLKDLAAAPNEPDNGENYSVLWYYENQTSNENPVFEFQQNDFLVESMVDLGHGAQPAIADVNGDGLPDLVVGNFSRFVPGGAEDPRLFLFLNTGTWTGPAFTLVDDDFLSMNQFSTTSFSFAPAFGDLDGDGDLDILVGENYGKLFYAENTAGAGNPMTFSAWQYEWQGIDVGLASTPRIVDLDRDGLPDLVIGERNGNINFFKNTGTANVPVFNPDPEADPNNFFLGQVDTRVPVLSILGYSTPAFFQVDGAWRMLTGNNLGWLELYSDIEENIYDVFTTVSETVGAVRVGERSHPATGDLNHDGLLDIVVGNARGGLSIYTTDIEVDPALSIQVSANELSLQVYPNPAADRLTVKMQEAVKEGNRLELFDVTGRVVWQQQWKGTKLELNTHNLPAGLYLLRVRQGERSGVRQIVIRR